MFCDVRKVWKSYIHEISQSKSEISWEMIRHTLPNSVKTKQVIKKRSRKLNKKKMPSGRLIFYAEFFSIFFFRNFFTDLNEQKLKWKFKVYFFYFAKILMIRHSVLFDLLFDMIVFEHYIRRESRTDNPCMVPMLQLIQKSCFFV